MQSCQQSSGQTVHQHGLAVSARYQALLRGETDGWQLPEWFLQHRQHLLNAQPPADLMALYHEFHDCGKPFCRQVDADGRQHFPHHAQISASIWRVNFGSGLIADLIQHDMDLHLLKPSTIDTFTRYDLASALLLTALSELHANAEMFGGTDSTSFKIKFKTLSKTGAEICRRIFKQTS